MDVTDAWSFGCLGTIGTSPISSVNPKLDELIYVSAHPGSVILRSSSTPSFDLVSPLRLLVRFCPADF